MATDSPARPPYQIPSMAEIAAGPPARYTGASLFSGCGGSSLGYRWGGVQIRWANEFIPSAAETYAANFPTTLVDPRDIRTIDPAEILAALHLAPGELDLLDGSPPCASFSTAGARSRLWGESHVYSWTANVKQRTDDLFGEYIRILRGLRPRVFVAENVAGLVQGVAQGHFKRILAALTASGYRVEAQLLDAQWLGVPQARRRLIFVGVREDLDRAPVFPAPLPYRYSMADAFAGLTAAPEPETNIDKYKIAGEWATIGAGGQSTRYFQLVRPWLSRPAPTIIAVMAIRGAAAPMHPTECRRFSLAELRRLCGFPDDFVLCGSFAERCERLGRAVPPPVMAAIARTLVTEILDLLSPEVHV